MASLVFTSADRAALGDIRNLTILSNPGPDFFPAAREVIRQVRDPGGYFLYAYAAVQVFAAAAAKTNLSNDKIYVVAREQPTPTVLGVLAFVREWRHHRLEVQCSKSRRGWGCQR
jgi:hypothetical protein